MPLPLLPSPPPSPVQPSLSPNCPLLAPAILRTTERVAQTKILEALDLWVSVLARPEARGLSGQKSRRQLSSSSQVRSIFPADTGAAPAQPRPSRMRRYSTVLSRSLAGGVTIPQRVGGRGVGLDKVAGVRGGWWEGGSSSSARCTSSSPSGWHPSLSFPGLI